jgi:hypothetical protein
MYRLFSTSSVWEVELFPAHEPIINIVPLGTLLPRPAATHPETATMHELLLPCGGLADLVHAYQKPSGSVSSWQILCG